MTFNVKDLPETVRMGMAIELAINSKKNVKVLTDKADYESIMLVVNPTPIHSETETVAKRRAENYQQYYKELTEIFSEKLSQINNS